MRIVKIPSRGPFIAADKMLDPPRWAIQSPPRALVGPTGHKVYQNKPWTWDTLGRTRSEAIRLAESVYGKPWKKLYRAGYRCSMVTLFGVKNIDRSGLRPGGAAFLRTFYPDYKDAE